MSHVTDEQCVLGAMLLSKTAITDVLPVLDSSSEFRLPAHRLIFDRIMDLHRRGQPADPVTVIPELLRRGELTQAGGAAYLHTLISTVLDPDDARRYAELITNPVPDA